MATDRDRLDIDFEDRATRSVPETTQLPDDLADSPTVKETEVSPAVAARAALPDNPGAGWQQGAGNSSLPARNPDPGAILTESAPGTAPGAPLNPGTGALPADDLTPAADAGLHGVGADAGLSQAMKNSLAEGMSGAPEHEGTAAGVDETTGTDETLIRGPRV